jgi:hypothetical protein
MRRASQQAKLITICAGGGSPPKVLEASQPQQARGWQPYVIVASGSTQRSPGHGGVFFPVLNSCGIGQPFARMELRQDNMRRGLRVLRVLRVAFH